jgi:hypothetical protein
MAHPDQIEIDQALRAAPVRILFGFLTDPLTPAVPRAGRHGTGAAGYWPSSVSWIDENVPLRLIPMAAAIFLRSWV